MRLNDRIRRLEDHRGQRGAGRWWLDLLNTHDTRPLWDREAPTYLAGPFGAVEIRYLKDWRDRSDTL